MAGSPGRGRDAEISGWSYRGRGDGAVAGAERRGGAGAFGDRHRVSRRRRGGTSGSGGGRVRVQASVPAGGGAARALVDLRQVRVGRPWPSRSSSGGEPTC